MRRLWLALGCVLLPALARAQPVPLHGAPQGVTACTIPDQIVLHTIGTGFCPFVSTQFHWKVPQVNIAHTHIECNLPHLGEVAGPFTVPCRFQLFHTAGKLSLIYSGGLVSRFAFDAPGQTFPIVGNPAGVVIVPFHLTIDPTIDVATQYVQPHGWFNVMFAERTNYDDGSQVDGQMFFTGWSMRDPSAPSKPEGEGTRIMLAAKASVAGYIFGAHLMEVRTPMLPLWAPLAAPVKYLDSSYSYGSNTALTADDGLYLNVYDNDYHNGVDGQVVDTVVASRVGGFGSSNLVVEDPTVIAAFQAPAGFPSGVHRHTLAWQAQTNPTQDLIGGDDHLLPHGQVLVSLISVDEAVAQNAVGCLDAACSNAVTDAPTVTPPVVTPPPPPPVKQCSGTVKGTSVDGATVTVTSGTITCSP